MLLRSCLHGRIDKQIHENADCLRRWVQHERPAFIYYNNDAEAHAVQNALKLKETLDLYA